MKRSSFFAAVLLSVFLPVFLSQIGKAENGRFGKGSEAGEAKTLTAGGIDYTFRWCPPGEFMMGSPKTEERRDLDEVQHKVEITRGFWLLETEITQQMWESVMGTTVEEQSGGSLLYGVGGLLPMYYVSWEEAQSFCEKLSRESGETILLPTEAQWEYACRAGTSAKYYFGENDRGLDENAWYIGDSDKDYDFCGLDETDARRSSLRKRSNRTFGVHRVKQKKPNAWGLYDMLGNVWEWCSDWYDGSYYANSPKADPQGPANGTDRVYRGGAWGDFARYCRSANRQGSDPQNNGTFRLWNEQKIIYLGFRVVLAPAGE